MSAEDIVENLSCVFPPLKVNPVKVPEEEEQQPGVVHLLAQLRQHHVALLLVVPREQHGRDVSKLLADLWVGGISALYPGLTGEWMWFNIANLKVILNQPPPAPFLLFWGPLPSPRCSDSPAEPSPPQWVTWRTSQTMETCR